MSVKDYLTFDRFKANAKDSHPELAQKEAATVHSVQGELGNIPQSSWSSIDEALNFPKDKVHKDGESVGIARCVSTVQTTPERLLGWMFHIDTDDSKTKHIKANGTNNEQYPNYVVARVNDHHQITYSCKKLPFPLVARDWLHRGIFTRSTTNLCLFGNSSMKRQKQTCLPTLRRR